MTERLGRATAGQLRRAGFVVTPTTTDNSATRSFEILCNHGDPPARAEHLKAVTRGDAFPPDKDQPK